MATELLTAQQLQHLLDVDASTIYRMAGDGRLPAVRIGRQWRFPAEAIEELLTPRLTGPRRGGSYDLPTTEPTASPWDRMRPGVLPSDLATAALEAVAPALGVTMVVTDLEGRPISDVVNPAPAIARRLDDPEFLAVCGADWRGFASQAHLAPRWQPAVHGFLCAHSLVRSGSSLVAMVLAGGITPDDVDDPELLALDPGRRQVVLDTLPRTAALLSRLVVANQPEPSPTE